MTNIWTNGTFIINESNVHISIQVHMLLNNKLFLEDGRMEKIYIIVGSQDLYGEECLREVAADA